MASPGDPTELVVLLAEDGTPCGTAAKAAVHHADTPPAPRVLLLGPRR